MCRYLVVTEAGCSTAFKACATAAWPTQLQLQPRYYSPCFLNAAATFALPPFGVNVQGEISVLPWTELEGLHRETSLIQVCESRALPVAAEASTE